MVAFSLVEVDLARRSRRGLPGSLPDLTRVFPDRNCICFTPKAYKKLHVRVEDVSQGGIMRPKMSLNLSGRLQEEGLGSFVTAMLLQVASE